MRCTAKGRAILEVDETDGRAAVRTDSRPDASTHGGGGTVLVTGAGGFVGAALVRTFADAGFAVRALARPSSDRTNLALPGLEIATGDMLDPASLEPALHGVRYVVHAAADYRLWARNPEDIVRANVEGTRNVMTAARRAGVERIVYTSSVAVLKPPHAPGARATERDGASAAQAIGAYKRSKVLAEDLARTEAARGLPVVIVNPSTPIGPRDVKPTPTGRVLVEAALGRMPAFVDTGLNLVHVDDVARGHLLALRHGRTGERYILGGEDVMLSELLGEVARLRGRRPPTVRLPVSAVMPLAAVAETLARFTGREPFVTFDALRMARHRMFFDDAKARAELGYTSRPWRDAVADALRWFRETGRIA